MGSALLAIDVGNSNTLAGVYQGDELLHEWRISTERSATADELAASHDQILRLRGGSLDELDAMIVASVVPTLTTGYRQLAVKYLDQPAVVVGPGIRTGMALAIDNPVELGADRLVNAVAAYRRYGGPCIVVDLGTATTLDVVSDAGVYLGGVIAPGMETSLDALTSRAARLVKVDLIPPERVIGRSTVESMRSGLVLGTVAMIDGLCAQIREQLTGTATIVATGGLAGMVSKLSTEIDHIDPMLTLDGLRVIYAMNAPSRPVAGDSR